MSAITTWRKAFVSYLKQYEAIQIGGDTADDTHLSAYNEARREMISTPAPTAGAIAFKLDAVAQDIGTPAELFEDDFVSLRQDLWRLDDQHPAGAWHKLWKALRCGLERDPEDGEIRLWIPEPSIIEDGYHAGVPEQPEPDTTIWLGMPQPPHLRIANRDEWAGAVKVLHMMLREAEGLSDLVMERERAGRSGQ